MIVAGTVEVRHGDDVIDTSGAGGFFAEIALLVAGSRTATVTTLTPSLLLKVDNRGFEAMLEADPRIRADLAAEMARRLERIDAASSLRAWPHPLTMDWTGFADCWRDGPWDS